MTDPMIAVGMLLILLLADVGIACADGRRLSSGPTEAPGDVDRPLTVDQLEAKFVTWCALAMGTQRGQELLHTLAEIADDPLQETTRGLYHPGAGRGSIVA
jgi:hypothetical protein